MAEDAVEEEKEQRPRPPSSTSRSTIITLCLDDQDGKMTLTKITPISHLSMAPSSWGLTTAIDS
jgi:hypothetical protein